MLTGHGKDVLSASEAIGLRNTNRQPDNTQKEVDHIQQDADAEHCRIPFWGKVIDGHRDQKDTFGDSPDQGTPFDVIVSDTSWEVDFPDCQLRNDVVGCCLKVGCLRDPLC